MPEGYMDAAAVPVPDTGDDTLREQLDGAAWCPGLIMSDIQRMSLVGRMEQIAREHTERAVEQARASERKLQHVEKSVNDMLAKQLEQAEADIERVRALATGRRGFTAEDVLAALDGTEATDG